MTDHVVLHSGLGDSLYYLCPGCEVFLPREYMRFCDCCGQRLGWDAIENQDREQEAWEETLGEAAKSPP